MWNFFFSRLAAPHEISRHGLGEEISNEEEAAARLQQLASHIFVFKLSWSFICISFLLLSSSWPSLQSLHRSRLGAEREAETAPDTNNFHVRATERARASVPGDSLPRHLHSRGDRHENRPHRGEGSGKENSNYIHKYPRHRPQTSPSKNIFNCFVRGTKNSENWKILPHEVGAVSVEKCSLARVGKFWPNLNWPDGASGLLLSSVFCWCWLSISGVGAQIYNGGIM